MNPIDIKRLKALHGAAVDAVGDLSHEIGRLGIEAKGEGGDDLVESMLICMGALAGAAGTTLELGVDHILFDLETESEDAA